MDYEYSNNPTPKYTTGDVVIRKLYIWRAGYKYYDLTVISSKTIKSQVRHWFTEEQQVGYFHSYKASDSNGAVFTVKENELSRSVYTPWGISNVRYYIMDELTLEIKKKHMVVDNHMSRMFDSTADYIAHVLGVDPQLIDVRLQK
jgi:broad-specificity NMP kinase